MSQNRWKTVNEIFHAALEVEPSRRHELVLAQANGDPLILSEVEQLLQADAEAGSYLERPISLSPAFSGQSACVVAGELLCDRFRIVREIAEGGMGQVFEAYDTELAVRVALKVIRTDIASNPDAIVRFRQEVRLARTITHPNICRTFDLEREARVIDNRTSEIIFLTMEFLAGETLSSHLKRTGPLSLDETLAIARQIAGALHAAHALGVTHRDMKPANIILVPSETLPQTLRVVITDFGLARLDPSFLPGEMSAFTGTGHPIGTLAYMAPEQLEGNAVSPATDIFAFGLILFEMLSGKRAYPSENFLSGMAQRLTGPPPSLRTLLPDLPETWSRALDGCLRVRPAERFQSATDVVAVLDGGRARLPRDRGQRTPWPILFPSSSPRKRLAKIAALFLGIVALSAGGLRFYLVRADSRVAPGTLIYLAPVQNETGEAAFDNLTALLQAGLTQSVQVNFVDQGRVGDILQQMTKPPDAVIDAPTAREIAMRAGAVRVVFVTVMGRAGSYTLHIDLQQPDNRPASFRNRWTSSFAWQSSSSTAASGHIAPELLQAVRDTSDWVRHEVGESAQDISTLDAPPGEVTTSNWSALTEFANAQRLEAKGNKEQAIAAYRGAIAADPAFSLAYAHLGDLLVSDNKRIEGYKAYLKALNEEGGTRLSRKERDFIAGSYATDTKDFESALAAFRDYSAFYPNDFNAWYYQAFPLQMLARPKEALDAALRADAVMRGSHPGGTEIAYICMILGQKEDVRKWIAIIRQRGNSELALYLEALEAFLERRFDDSESLLSQLQHAPQKKWVGFGFFARARVQAERADYIGALSTLAQEEIELGPVGKPIERAALALDRAYILCRTGFFDRCVADVSAAVDLESSPDTVLSASDILGTFIPAMSHVAAAQALLALRHMQGLLAGGRFGVVDDLAQERLAGEIDLASGKPQAALLKFRKADALEAPFRARDYLARCLLSAAAHESNPGAATQMREQALAGFGRTALQLASVWRKPRDYPPGFAADMMENYVRLAKSLHRADAKEASVDTALKELRPHSPALRDR